MRKITVLGMIACSIVFMAACGGGNSPESSTSAPVPSSGASSDAAKYDPERGKGKFTSLELTAVDPARVENGRKIFDVKCAPCHKLSDEKLVGPGWAGVTKRNKPVWIMNFITNPDAMIDVDPKLQAQLELCLVRMPNQSLSDADARNLLEFMRNNDGDK